MLYTICIYYLTFLKTTIKTCFAQTQMLANEQSFPQTFSTIPRKNFTDRPYNKPGQVGYFKVPQGS